MQRILRCSLLSTALAGALFATSAWSLGTVAETRAAALTRGIQPAEAGVDRIDGRFKSSGAAITLAEPAFTARAAAPEAMAREFLAARHDRLGLKTDEAASLARTTLRAGRHFSVVRFEQRHAGLPVYGSDVAVSVQPNGKVIYVANSAVEGLGAVANADSKTEADALAVAKQYLGASEFGYQKLRKMVYASPDGTRVVWRVNATVQAPTAGDWELLVDAGSGEVLRAEDRMQYATGTGTIWTPDPLSYEKVAYGGGYVDGDNADTPELTGALVTVTLEDITQNGANYELSGPHVVCADIDLPTDAAACPSQPGTDFSVTRSAATFDAVMVYYHVTRYLKYVNDTLDIEAMPLSHPGGIKVDPHGCQNCLGGDDNSRYSPSAEDLAFGHGGVDDAQDADVIIHELGHGLHDWITGGNAARGEGMGEGFGDYTAGSYSRDYPDQWATSDAAYNWVFNWDGHNDFWPGRVLNYQLTRTYEQARTQAIHTAGQYWSSCNLEARKNLQALDVTGGGQAFDKAYFQGMSMTGSSTNQKDAAQAVINAAAALGYTQAQIDAIGVAYNSGNEDGNTGCTYGVTVPGAGTDPKIAVDPASLSGTAAAGASATASLTIRNTGGGSLDWSIVETTDAARGHFPADQRQARPVGSAHAMGPKIAPSSLSGPSASGIAASVTFGAAVNGYAQRASSTAANRALNSLDFNTPGTLTMVGSANLQPFWGSGFLNGDTSTLYMLGDSGLFSVDTATGVATEISASAGGGDVWGMTADPTTQTLYWIGPSSDQELSTVDPATGATALIGAITGAAAGDTLAGIAADAQGHLYGIDADSDSLVSIDKTSGDTAVIGPLGVDADNVTGLAFDPASGTLYFANAATGMYTIDVATGTATLIGTVQDGAQLVALAIGGSGTTPGGCTNPSDVPWLSVSPASGSAAAAGSSAVTVTMDATDLAAGSYDADLCIASNDATNPQVTVPVSFTVTASGGDPCSAEDSIFCDGFDGKGGAPSEQPVQDPSFEATPGSTEENPDWTGVDDNSSSGGTPFYSVSDPFGPTTDAHTGDFVVWGGGWGEASSQHWLQSVTIAAGGSRYLNFWRRVGGVPSGGTATLKVSVDGTEVWTFDALTAEEESDWVSVSVDVSSYADDAAHEIRFDYAATGSTDGNVYVDDVTIDAAAPAPRQGPSHRPVVHGPQASKTQRR